MSNSFHALVTEHNEGYESIDNLVLHGVPSDLNESFVNGLFLLALWDHEFGLQFDPTDQSVIADEALDALYDSFSTYSEGMEDRKGSVLYVEKAERLSQKEVAALALLTPRLTIAENNFSALEQVYDYLVHFEGKLSHFGNRLNSTNSNLNKIFEFLLNRVAEGQSFAEDWIEAINAILE